MSDVQPETPTVKDSGENAAPEAVKSTATPTDAASTTAAAGAGAATPDAKDEVDATPGGNEPVDLNKKPGDAPFIIKNRASNPVAEQVKKSNPLLKVKEWKKDIQYRLKDWWSEPSGKRWVVGVVLGALVFGVAGAAIMIVLANRKSIKNSIVNLVKNKLGWVSEKEQARLGVNSPVKRNKNLANMAEDLIIDEKMAKEFGVDPNNLTSRQKRNIAEDLIIDGRMEKEFGVDPNNLTSRQKRNIAEDLIINGRMEKEFGVDPNNLTSRPKFEKYETEDAKKERLRLEEQETGPLPDHEVSVPAQRPTVNWTLDNVDDEDEEEVELEDLPRNQNSGYVATGDNTGPKNTSVAIEDVVPARVYSSKRPSLEELLKDKDEVEGPTTTPPRSGLKNG